jgi:DNA-binding LacI/PurR family transcriptional regulator
MDRQALKLKITYGMVKEIAQKNGWSTKTVSNFINGRSNSLKVERAVLSAITELNIERSTALK